MYRLSEVHEKMKELKRQAQTLTFCPPDTRPTDQRMSCLHCHENQVDDPLFEPGAYYPRWTSLEYRTYGICGNCIAKYQRQETEEEVLARLNPKRKEKSIELLSATRYAWAQWVKLPFPETRAVSQEVIAEHFVKPLVEARDARTALHDAFKAEYNRIRDLGQLFIAA